MKKLIILITLAISLFSCMESDWNIDGKIYKFEKITNNVFIIHGPLSEPNELNQGFMNNPGLIVGKNGLIVVDPGGTYPVGKKVITEIEKISNLPIVGIFNTHIHGDHWLGNQAILEKYPSVKIYSHPNMLTRLKSGDGEVWLDIMDKSTKGKSVGTKVTYPTNTIQNLEEIIIAGEIFIIHAPTISAHTNTDIVIEHKQSGTIFMGDNLFLNRLGMFDESSDIHNNIQVLKYVKNLNAKNYVPGHGKTGNYKITVAPFLKYLEIIKSESMLAYENDLQGYQIKESVVKKLNKYHNWSRFEETIGTHLIKMITEVEERDF